MFILGCATTALLLLAAFYPSSQDLSEVFYPPPGREHPPSDRPRVDHNPAPHTAPRQDRAWIPVPPLPPIVPDRTIFLLETSGRAHIHAREWCAVESAARAHPRHTVLLLTAAARVGRSALAASVLRLNNTRLARLRFGEAFRDTAMEEWYRSRAVLRSWWQASHMSDALRFALLAKFGGIYLDTDVIVRRSMEGESGARW